MSKPFIGIELDKHRNIRYGYKALIQLEEMLGCNLSGINMSKLTLKDTAIILLCGLMHEDKTLTLDKLIDIIDENGEIEEIASKIAEAFELSFGNNKKKAVKKMK